MRNTIKQMKIKSIKGISLISLTITVIVLMIITSILIYNAKNGIKIRALNLMKNDIEMLDDKINAYYTRYGALPIEIRYLGDLHFTKQSNDSGNYYIIDLKALDGVSLNYGVDYNYITNENDTVSRNDVYIIDEQSHHIYYAKGVQMDGAWYYTTTEDEEIKLNNVITITQKTESIKSNGEWDEEQGINTPVLGRGMTPIYWDESGNEKIPLDNYIVGTVIQKEGKIVEYAFSKDTTDSNNLNWIAVESTNELEVSKKVYEDGTYYFWTKNNSGDIERSEGIDVTGTCKWYDYVAGNNVTDTKTSKWANAKTEDGSYWVWIPRFAYKITSGWHQSYSQADATGAIDVVFIDKQNKDKNGNIYTRTYQEAISGITSGGAMKYYVVHPAFKNGNGNYNNGEWDKDISGFWVAKYESSMEKSTNNYDWKEISAIESYNRETNNILTTKAGNSSTYCRVVSKPNRYAWNWIDCSTANLNSRSYDVNNNSHLMKNSEWGAVAYLTHSKYGRNRNEVGMNTYYYNSTYQAVLTGFGGTDYQYTNSVSDTNRYNGSLGLNASSTGNIYGVYDLSGGNWEYTAAYCTKASFENGDSLKVENNESTKYVTVYPTGSETEISYSYGLWQSNYGDSIYEISGGTIDTKGWFSDCTGELLSGGYFVRGGSHNRKLAQGIFAFADNQGQKDWDVGFRIVLICE